MKPILDASALLALVFDEPGADVVARLAGGSSILSVNFSEVIQRVISIDGNPDRAEEAVDRLEIEVFSFDRKLARIAAELRQPTAFIGASFADRACLSLGLLTGRPILPVTAHGRNWTSVSKSG